MFEQIPLNMLVPCWRLILGPSLGPNRWNGTNTLLAEPAQRLALKLEQHPLAYSMAILMQRGFGGMLPLTLENFTCRAQLSAVPVSG